MNECAIGNREAVEDFVDEALDSLLGLSERLENFRLAPDDNEQINAVFRAIHSMKGCAAFLDLDAIKSFSHSIENTLDDIRKGSVILSEDLQQAIVEGFDVLEGFLHEAAHGNVISDLEDGHKSLLKRVKDLADSASVGKRPEAALLECAMELASMMSQHELPEAKQWGRQLKTLINEYHVSNNEAEIAQSVTAGDTENTVLAPSDFAKGRCFCGDEDVTNRVLALIEMFQAFSDGRYDESVGKSFLKAADVFADWAENKGEAKLAESIAAAAADFQMIFDSPMDLDDNLLSVVWDQLRPALAGLYRGGSPESGADRTSGKKSTSDTAAETKNKADERAGENKPQKSATKARFVRVREERLDDFLEHVSRLFITSELFKDVHARMADSGQLGQLVDELRQINNSLKVESVALQHGVVSLRRVSVSGLFSKFPRMARTLASKLGKKITVHVSGEETEIDKTLAEDLDAPLTHLIRNVVDHAIEMPDDRKKRGVNETGNLWLSAEQTKNHIRITVRDDGRGIDPMWLREKAVEKGAVSREEADAMPDEEALRLIFHPGFSTAEKVSDISGRGVGMDVVRTTLADYNGEVFVDSEVGVGTTLLLEIPIRQATLVIDGLMVAEGGQEYVVPFEYIREISDIAAEDFSTAHGRTVVTVRQGTYDAITLSDVLGVAKASGSPAQKGGKQATALLSCREGTFCLLVDRVVGHRQVVVTGLKDVVAGAEKTAGVAQLGGGKLALVLNVPEIIKSL